MYLSTVWYAEGDAGATRPSPYLWERPPGREIISA